MPILAINKRAKYDYEILETFEAGIVLEGFEVKAIREKKISLKGAYVSLRNNEIFLVNAHISPYQPLNVPDNYNPTRPRKLLLHKKEINYLIGKNKEKGLTLIPLKVYTKKEKIKLEFAIAKGKKKFDKREQIKKREIKREIERKLKSTHTF